MLLLVGTVLGFLLAGSAFLVLRGLVGVFRRRPKAALAAVGGVGLFVVVVILLGAASLLLGPSTEAADSSTEKARVLSKNISALMNLCFLGLPFGTFAGIVAEIRARRPSNMPLQQPKADNSRSTVDEPGPRGS
jgi:DMSO reductase anchor subunit